MCSCIKSIIKTLLYGLNAILLILALALLGVGIYCQVEPNPDHFTNGMPNGPAKDKVVDMIKAVENGGVPMMIISGVIVGTTILGICVASKGSKCLLGIYFTLMLLLLIGMVIGTILGFSVYLDDWFEQIEAEIKKTEDATVQKGLNEFLDLLKNIEYLGLPVALFIIIALVLNLTSTCVFFKKGQKEG